MAATRPAHLTAQEIIDIDAGKIVAVLIDSDHSRLNSSPIPRRRFFDRWFLGRWLLNRRLRLVFVW